MPLEPGVETADAFAAIEHYFEAGWTDGLPVVPPTGARVGEFLATVDRDPGDVLMRVEQTGRECSVHTAAVNAVMAGCKPEYFRVVVAAVEAMGDERWGAGEDYYRYLAMASTGGAAYLLVINGPVRQQLGMNGGINVLGPGNRANATIGRTLRLIALNALAMTPGELDMSSHGHPGKYTLCVPELEDHSPWSSLSADYGFAPGESTVALFGVQSAITVNGGTSDPEGILLTIAQSIATASHAYIDSASPYVVIMGPRHANALAGNGWTKAQAQEYLWMAAKQPLAELDRTGKLGNYAEARRAGRIPTLIEYGGTPYLHICRSPQDIVIVVAGGDSAGISTVLPPWGYVTRPGEIVIRPIASA